MIRPTAVCAFLLALALGSSAQTTIDRDPEIAAMVREVSPDSLKSYINQDG